jgi:magnesium-transporting ATPase (P-type)
VENVSDEFFYAGINTRILSGDYKACVLRVGFALNVIDNDNESESECMSGQEFRAFVAPLVKKDDQGERYSWTFKDNESRRTFKDKIMKSIKVIYRANPEDKHMFVACMQ